MIAILSLIISILAIAIALLYIFYRQRNQILENLRNSEAQMRLLLESVGDGVFGVDLDGNCTFINPSALRILGFQSAQDVEGKNIHSIIHHTRQDGSPCLDRECNIYRAFRENQCFHIDSEILWRVDGTHFDVEYRSNPIVVNGKVTGSVASFSDITERKQIEGVLEYTQKNLLNAQRIAHLGSWEMEIASGHSYWSDEFFRICGLQPQSLKPSSDFGLQRIYPDDREAATNAVTRAIEKGEEYRIEKRIVRPDGSIRWVLSQGEVILDDQQAPLKLIGSFLDITERKQAEEALRISEEKYRHIFDSILDVYAEIGLDGTILEVSPSAESQTGYPREELLGKNMGSFYANPSDREKLLEQLYRDGQINDYEALMVDKNGKERFYSYTGKIIVDANGKPQKLAGVMRNIVERKQAEAAHQRAEESLRKAHDELEHRVKERTKELAVANEELKKEIAKQKQAEEQARQHQAELAHMARLNTMGEMATGMAHELNQPLAAISISAEACLRMTRNGEEMPDKLPKALESIVNQAGRAGEIIQHLRNFVKKQSPQKVTIDLNQLVMEVLDFTETEMKQHHIELVLELEQSLPALMADGIQIEQVLLNLVRNSIESMEHAQRPNRQLIVRTRLNSAGSAQAEVVDNGLGMNADELSHVFEPFVTTKGTKGMGMGLSISRSILEAHNGRLWAESRPGEGAEFYFTLPVNSDNSK